MAALLPIHSMNLADLQRAFGAKIQSPAAQIAAEEAEKAGVAVGMLYERSRLRPVAWARQNAMRRLKDELGWSYPRIGRYFRRDHTTAMHGVLASRKRLNASILEAAQ